MRAPPPVHPRRPNTVRRSPPRTGTRAAVELVRIEFERASHLRELSRLRRRAAAALSALEGLDARAAQLAASLGRGGSGREDGA